MKLEKFIKNKKSKGLVIGMSLGALVALSGVAIYKSYAIYKEEKNYNVIQGIIPDFGYDVKVAITVDDAETEEVPERSDGNNYYKVEVNCHDGEKKVDGEWDYNAWQLKIDGVSSGTKCNLAFAPELNKEEYQRLIEAGIEYRRNTYRGKNLTDLFSTEKGKQKFYQSISDGTFADIFVGDYIVDDNAPLITFDNGNEDNVKNTKNQKVVWLIADIDNYMNSGGVTNHHVTVIPAYPLQTAKMNEKNTTQCGYAGSNMVKLFNQEESDLCTAAQGKDSILENVYNTYINCQKCTFKDHVLKYESYLTSKVNKTAASQIGSAGYQGATDGWSTFQRQLDLMSEVNVTGTTIASSSAHDTGIDNMQYAIFQLKPELRNSYNNISFDYWLKDVASADCFVWIQRNGVSIHHIANFEAGVRPRFLVGVPDSE